jgi:hypothetical protein
MGIGRFSAFVLLAAMRQILKKNKNVLMLFCISKDSLHSFATGFHKIANSNTPTNTYFISMLPPQPINVLAIVLLRFDVHPLCCARGRILINPATSFLLSCCVVLTRHPLRCAYFGGQVLWQGNNFSFSLFFII